MNEAITWTTMSTKSTKTTLGTDYPQKTVHITQMTGLCDNTLNHSTWSPQPLQLRFPPVLPLPSEPVLDTHKDQYITNIAGIHAPQKE